MAAATAGMVDTQYQLVEQPKGPQPRQSPKAAVSSPLWSQVAQRESQPIVAAPAVEPVVASSSSSASSSLAGDEVGPESGHGPNGSTSKRAPWNRPSNGPGPEAAEPVIGADSWPALSASPKRMSRKSPPESAKISLDGSSAVSVPQGPGNVSSSASSSRQLNSHVKAQANASDPAPRRQRSMRPNSGNTSSNAADALQSPSPRNPSLETRSTDSSPRADNQRSGSVSEKHGGNEHQQPARNSFRSRGGGTYQHGDGSHSQNYGNRRDQDRSNHEWNSHRGFNHNRESRMQQNRGYPRYGRGPHPAAPVASPASGPYITTPQPRHFGGPPMNYNQMPPHVFYVPVQPPMNFVPPMQPHMVYFSQPDPTLRTRIYDQINYYFSNENLVRDTYLRRNMDEQGWVPVALIAGFKKVLQLTDDVQLILDVVRTSSVVEVQGDKLRRRNDWDRWIIPQTTRSVDASGAQSTGDPLANSVQTLSLNEGAGNSNAGKAETDARPDTSAGTSQ